MDEGLLRLKKQVVDLMRDIRGFRARSSTALPLEQAGESQHVEKNGVGEEAVVDVELAD